MKVYVRSNLFFIACLAVTICMTLQSSTFVIAKPYTIEVEADKQTQPWNRYLWKSPY